MKIEVKRQRGYAQGSLEVIDLDQYQIFVDGKLYGYAGMKPGLPVCPIVKADDKTREAVVAKVREVRGDDEKTVIASPPSPPSEIETDPNSEAETELDVKELAADDD